MCLIFHQILKDIVSEDEAMKKLGLTKNDTSVAELRWLNEYKMVKVRTPLDEENPE